MQIASICTSVQFLPLRAARVPGSILHSAIRPLLTRGAAATQARELRWCLALPPCKVKQVRCQGLSLHPLPVSLLPRPCCCDSRVFPWLNVLWMQVTWTLTHALLCFPKFSSLLHPRTSTSVRALASRQALAPCTLAPRIRRTCCAALTRCFCVSSQMRRGPPYGSTSTARNSPTGTVRMLRGPVILLFLWGIFRAADFGSKRPQLLLRLATSWKLPLHWQMRLILGAGSLTQTGALAAFLRQPFMQQCRGRVTVGW